MGDGDIGTPGQPGPLAGIDIRAGSPLALGVRDCCDGYNFAIFSRHAERVELQLFGAAEDPEPSLTIDLGPAIHRTEDVWHVLVEAPWRR